MGYDLLHQHWGKQGLSHIIPACLSRGGEHENMSRPSECSKSMGASLPARLRMVELEGEGFMSKRFRKRVSLKGHRVASVMEGKLREGAFRG